MAKEKTFFERLKTWPLLLPVVALVLVMAVNIIYDAANGNNPFSFFTITLQNTTANGTILYGRIIDILNRGSEAAILAIGMTLVVSSSAGTDISVGSVMSLAASVCCVTLAGYGVSSTTELASPLIVGLIAGVAVGCLCGAFNGFLVAHLKIQPMVATLILFTAGRSIAAWINNNELPIISDPVFGYFGNFIPGIPVPTPFFIAVACMIVIFLVLKFTNLGLYTQAVGINADSSRLNGLNPAFIKFITFVILGLCVAVAGFIKVSRLSSINYSVIAKDIEMDAILAVALGGNALGGGKFNMPASILGAYVIQFLTTTLYKFNVQSDALPAYKAVVVIILVVLSAPSVREYLGRIGKKYAGTRKEAA